MKKIWKYTFPIVDKFSLDMPFGARVLTALVQSPNQEGTKRSACLWAEVNDLGLDSRTQTRHFMVIGTGHPLPEGNLSWVATFIDSPFVCHLYELKWV